MKPRIATAHKGLWVAFYGPDGAGKSSVIECLFEEMAGTFPALHRVHLRQRFSRHAGSTDPVVDPHGQRPRGALSSLLKVLYLCVHHTLGYWLVIRRRIRAGHFVAFDRYYEDYSIDPRRYRLTQSAAASAAWLSRFVPQPDLSVVLDVPAEELQRRKPEVTTAESRRVRRAYLRRFSDQRRSVIVNADRPRFEVVETVLAELAHLVRRESFQQTSVKPQASSLSLNS